MMFAGVDSCPSVLLFETISDVIKHASVPRARSVSAGAAEQTHPKWKLVRKFPII